MPGDNIPVAGGSGYLTSFDEVTINAIAVLVQRMKLGWGLDGVWNETSLTAPLPVSLQGVAASKLTKTGLPSEEKLCTNALQDYPLTNPMPAGTKYATVYSPSPCIVAMGEAVTAGAACVGVYVAGGSPTTFPVTVTGVSADDTPHVWSLVGATTIRVTYSKD